MLYLGGKELDVSSLGCRHSFGHRGQSVTGSTSIFGGSIFTPGITAHILVNVSIVICLQCFDAVGWAAGRASGP